MPYKIKVSHANVYAQPSTDSAVVGKLPLGLFVEGRVEGDWLVIDRGYVLLTDVVKKR